MKYELHVTIVPRHVRSDSECGADVMARLDEREIVHLHVESRVGSHFSEFVGDPALGDSTFYYSTRHCDDSIEDAIVDLRVEMKRLRERGLVVSRGKIELTLHDERSEPR